MAAGGRRVVRAEPPYRSAASSGSNRCPVKCQIMLTTLCTLFGPLDTAARRPVRRRAAVPRSRRHRRQCGSIPTSGATRSRKPKHFHAILRAGKRVPFLPCFPRTARAFFRGEALWSDWSAIASTPSYHWFMAGRHRRRDSCRPDIFARRQHFGTSSEQSLGPTTPRASRQMYDQSSGGARSSFHRRHV